MVIINVGNYYSQNPISPNVNLIKLVFTALELHQSHRTADFTKANLGTGSSYFSKINLPLPNSLFACRKNNGFDKNILG